MFKRLKETILEIIQQADLILLGLCCAASVFGIAMIYSATRYNTRITGRSSYRRRRCSSASWCISAFP